MFANMLYCTSHTEQRASMSAGGDYASVSEVPSAGTADDGAELDVEPSRRWSRPWIMWRLRWLLRKMFPPGFWSQLLGICKISWKTARY